MVVRPAEFPAASTGFSSWPLIAHLKVVCNIASAGAIDVESWGASGSGTGERHRSGQPLAPSALWCSCGPIRNLCRQRLRRFSMGVKGVRAAKRKKYGGERGIRTLGAGISDTHDFQSCSFSQLGHLSAFRWTYGLCSAGLKLFHHWARHSNCRKNGGEGGIRTHDPG